MGRDSHDRRLSDTGVEGRPETSGDLLADRRYLYGQALTAEGDHAAAADLFEQALEIVPGWGAGWFALGEARARLGADAAAAAAFARAAAHDPAGVLGASLALAALQGQAPPSAADPAYVSRLFDEYSARFDTHLRDDLGYRAPELLCAALDRVAPGRMFANVLDLGCGTGLMGAAIRARAGRLAGIDLSPKMIALARGKALYDALEVGDLLPALADGRRPDLLLAADVLVYIGDLGPLLSAARQAIREKGLFAFTVQEAPQDADIAVGADRRFSHSPAHVAARAAHAGWAIASMEPHATRRDGGRDVPGLVVVLA